VTSALADAPTFALTNIGEIFRDRAYDLDLEGTHTRLNTNYTAEQLAPAVEAYKAFTGWRDGTTNQCYSDLAHLLGVYAEHCDRGLGCHLSLSQEHYRQVPGRYRAKWETYWHAKYSTERLVKFGLVEHTLGNRWQRKESVLRAGPLLKAFCEHLRAEGVDPTEAPAAARECIIVRDTETRHPIAFEDNEWTLRARPMLTALNEAQQRQGLLIDGQPWFQDPMVMIYAGGLDRGGRMYHTGTSHQNIRKALRATMQIVDSGGVVHNTAEVDFEQLHPRMAYEISGADMPPGDLYDLSDLMENPHRTVAKIALNTLFSSRNTASARYSIAQTLAKHNRPESRPESDEPLQDWEIYRCMGAAQKYITALTKKHSAIAHLFGTDLGARLQTLDGRIALLTMHRHHRRHGTAPYCVHDSFIVPRDQAEDITHTMERVYRTQMRKFKGENSIPVKQREGTGGTRTKEASTETTGADSQVHMEVFSITLISPESPLRLQTERNSDPVPVKSGEGPPRGSPPAPAPIRSAPPEDEGYLQNNDLDNPFLCPERHTPASFMAALVARMDRGLINTNRRSFLT
jgi:hypothetical protein